MGKILFIVNCRNGSGFESDMRLGQGISRDSAESGGAWVYECVRMRLEQRKIHSYNLAVGSLSYEL